MDPYGDGVWRRHSSPIVSMVELMNPGKIVDIMIHELGCRRSSMGVNAGVPFYHSVAKFSVRFTDRLHHADEHENTLVHRKKTQ